MNFTTWEEARRYAFSPDGRDTCASITDAELARAIAATGNLLAAAVALSEARGRVVAREDIAARVQASPSLQAVLETARAVSMGRAVGNCIRAIAERRQERKRVVQEWRRLHEERVRLCELRRNRSQGPRAARKPEPASLAGASPS